MPSPKVYRRETLRKAKAAYKKRGTPAISEAERRQMARRAELWERAEKIKAKEQRRKANKEKKDKKLERDKEAKERQGFQEPVPKLPEGQITLSGFVRKPNDHLQSMNPISIKFDAEESNCGESREWIAQPSLDREKKPRRRVRFVEPEVHPRMRLPLRLKSPPIIASTSSPQSGPQESTTSLEIGSLDATLSLPNATDDEDWASLFPSDTQVGRELREWSPLSNDGARSSPQQAMSHAKPANSSDQTYEIPADQLLLTQSVWDSFPSDTQVQRELDASSPTSPEGPHSQDSRGIRATPVSIGSGDSTLTRSALHPTFRELDDAFLNKPQIEICQTSDSGMKDFPNAEDGCGEVMTVPDGPSPWSTNWLPSSTAEVSAFFDSDIDD